jgi:hypothetical protein
MLLGTILMQITIPDSLSSVGGGYNVFSVNVMEEILTFKRNQVENLDASTVNMYVALAVAVAAVFILVWMAVELYPVIAGDRRLEIMPLLRPFALAFVISTWQLWIPLFMLIGNAVESESKRQFDLVFEENRGLMEQRFKLFDRLNERLTTVSVYAERGEHHERASNLNTGNIVRAITDPFGISAQIAKMQLLIMGKIKMFFYGIIEYISLLIMNSCVCAVLFIQAMSLIVLIILGPLAFAFSCLKPWRDSWSEWFARFFSVSLWSGLAYLICWGAAKLMNAVVRSELAMLDRLMDIEMYEAAVAVSLSEASFFLLPIVCILTAFGMFAVFPLSTWIIRTSGGHAAMGAAFGAAAATVAVAGKAAGGGGGK